MRDLKAIVVKPGADPTLRVAPRASPGQPTILPRSAWGADEKLRKGGPVLAPRIRAVVIHHTATPNGYDRRSGAERDPQPSTCTRCAATASPTSATTTCSTPRAGSTRGATAAIDRNVVGAHTAGFNTGTVGVALIGNFTSATPRAKELKALESLLAWRLDLAHVDPQSRVTLTSEGNDRYAKGQAGAVPGDLRRTATPAPPTARATAWSRSWRDPRRRLPQSAA